ncbi:MAG: GPR endopeptidase [Romboutsia sp.]|uniref:GPR endopeptidase n=1 Tax=Romboutsia sp. TaxID=1965302 RepID=UPI003F30CF3F
MISIRTDLALEAREMCEDGQSSKEIPGVKLDKKELENCTVTKVEVIDEQGAEIMNKGIGKYITLESNLMKFDDDDSREEMIDYLKEELIEILGKDKTKKTLVIGLGNWNITSDALGPKTVSKTLVTRHIFKNYNKDYDDDFTEVAALSPGVMGITGIETSETVKSIVESIKPDRVIAIDALASRKMERVNSTIQISTAGIAPGGGVGNKRKALNKEYLGVDVIAIGVPTVVDAATLTSDVLDLAIDNLISQSEGEGDFYNMLKQLKEEEKYHLIKDSLDPYDKNLIVTPKDIDETIENLSIIISEGLNRSLHPGRITK